VSGDAAGQEGRRAPRLVLASSSTSRRDVLTHAGLAFEVAPADVDERWEPSDDPATVVRSLARAKAHVIAASRPGDYVLGCDSLFFVDGVLAGKPASPDEIDRRWREMAGRSGVLYTGHALDHDGRSVDEVVATTVYFGEPTADERAAYVSSGEALGASGAFTLEGRSAAFIERVDGDAHNVLGLSVAALRRLLAIYGVPISALWR
jgi:septum formation protein